MLQSISLTWLESAPPGTKVVEGKWWAADEKRSQWWRSSSGRRSGWGCMWGRTITFAAQDTQFVATVVALTKADGQHAFSRAEFILPQAALAGLPVVWYGGRACRSRRMWVSCSGRCISAYPTVTVINVAQALETVRAVVIQITYVIQFLAAFSIFAGMIILASSIAGTRYRRIREVVVLKTLGATRGRIATVFSIEFAVLGLVAGVVGIVFANSDCAGAADSDDGGVSLSVGMDGGGAGGDGGSDGGDGLGGESSDSGAEAA